MVKYLYKVGIFLLRKDENKLDLTDLSEKINSKIENFEKFIRLCKNNGNESLFDKEDEIKKSIKDAKNLIITNPILNEEFIKQVNNFKESVSTKEIERIKKIPEKIIKIINESLNTDKEYFNEEWIITSEMTRFHDISAIETLISLKSEIKEPGKNDDENENENDYPFIDIPTLYLYNSLYMLLEINDIYPVIGHNINEFYKENFREYERKIINPPKHIEFYLINILIQKNLNLFDGFMVSFFASAMYKVLLYMNDYLDKHIDEMYSKKISKNQKTTPRKYTIKIQENRDKVLSIYLNSQQIKMSDDWINLIYSVSKNKYSLQEEYNKIFGNTQNDSEANLKKFRIDISNKINKINKRIKENLQIVDKSLKKEDIDKMTLLSLPRSSENLFIDYEIFDIIY